jgi:hypothetical protein
VAVQIATGKICAILGPDIGKQSDINSLRQHQSELGLKEGELLLADRGYQGHELCLSRYKNSRSYRTDIDDYIFNELLDSVRQIVECTLKRIKDFGVLGSAGRFHCDREKHVMVFNVCCQITNMKLDRDPVWGGSEQIDFLKKTDFHLFFFLVFPKSPKIFGWTVTDTSVFISRKIKKIHTSKIKYFNFPFYLQMEILKRFLWTEHCQFLK